MDVTPKKYAELYDKLVGALADHEASNPEYESFPCPGGEADGWIRWLIGIPPDRVEEALRIIECNTDPWKELPDDFFMLINPRWFDVPENKPYIDALKPHS